jgi:hypothetical protein
MIYLFGILYIYILHIGYVDILHSLHNEDMRPCLALHYIKYMQAYRHR